MKKKRIIFVSAKKCVLYAVTAALMLLLAACPEQTVPAAKNALMLCVQNIIPSLFPFFVLSQLLIKTGFGKVAGKFLSPLMKLLFGVSGAGGAAFFIGIISGYPMGAKTVCELYKAGELGKNESERLLPYCNNSGPLFIIGAVGVGMLGSRALGMQLYVIHIISAVLTGIMLRFFGGNGEICINKTTEKADGKKDVGAAFSESVREAVFSILAVCGFVVFFAAVSAPFSFLFGEGAWGSIKRGFLEVTGGASYAAQNCSFDEGMVIISGLLGFGGICVFLQVMGIVKEESLSVRPYFFGKICQGIISSALCGMLLKRMSAVSTFKADGAISFETGNFGAAVTSVFVICAFYFFILLLRKNFKKY